MQAAMGDSIQHAREAIGSGHDLQDMQRAVSHDLGLYKPTRLAPPSPLHARDLVAGPRAFSKKASIPC